MQEGGSSLKLWNTLRKGVKAGLMAIREQGQELNDSRVIALINEFNNSNKRNLMETGKRYYEVENDIMNRKITKIVKGTKVEETYKANNKLAHSKYKSMVDEKVSYLLSRDITLKSDKDDYTKKIQDILGKKFQYQLSLLGYEASNKGLGWLQPYIDQDGNFSAMVIPSEQCIPIWTDSSHTELEAMIRVYPTLIWEFNKRKTITNVEVWTADSILYYRLDGTSLLIPYTDKNQDENGPVAHFKRGDEWKTWGKVPFVPFKNNHLEMPDIRFVKTLLDAYDLSRSEAANYVEEVKNLIFVLYGYGGEDLHEFMRKINEDRAIPLDATKEDGAGVEALTPTMDITALKEHYEQLKRDIVEDGQSINKDLDKFGSAPSGIALKFMYAGLDLKANAMETQFKFGFESLMYFVNIYLGESGSSISEIADIDIVFNRDMQINEAEKIDNCGKSKGTISDETIIANHPWVKDMEAEKAALEKQKQEEQPYLDKIPLGGE